MVSCKFNMLHALNQAMSVNGKSFAGINSLFNFRKSK